MNICELYAASKFYYEMYEFSGNQDWLEAAHDCERDIDVLEGIA